LENITCGILSCVEPIIDECIDPFVISSCIISSICVSNLLILSIFSSILKSIWDKSKLSDFLSKPSDWSCVSNDWSCVSNDNMFFDFDFFVNSSLISIKLKFVVPENKILFFIKLLSITSTNDILYCVFVIS